MRGSLTNRSAGEAREEAAVSAVGPKLVAEDVAVTYESRGRQTLAVSGVNLSMADGEFVAIDRKSVV